jgi:hypothetical protein
MDVDRFWELNQGLEPETAVDELRTRLSKLEPSEIEAYQAHFDEAFASAYQWIIWAAAYIIDGGCSDDGFMDFRYGLISRGKSVFTAALSDPESLLDVANDRDDGYIPNESFGYVAGQVYKSKTGQLIPGNDVAYPSNPSGEDWDFDDERLCKQKLPKLWAKFG